MGLRKKEDLLKAQFKMLEGGVTAVCVSEDYHDFRTATPRTETPMKVSSWCSGRVEDFLAFNIQRGGWRLTDAQTQEGKRLPLEGVYEFRIKVQVQGRELTTEPAEVKTVEGAIRIVLVPQGGMAIEKIRADSMHHYSTNYYRVKAPNP